MKLFKNVGIEDLRKITEEGILPISKTNNFNWNGNKRANNSREVVYLFSPTEANCQPHYGFVLLEVEVEGAIENALDERDENVYTEFIIEEVKPEEITAIYIPKIFKEKVAEMVEGLNVTFVEMTAGGWYDGEKFETLSEAQLNQFAKTAEVIDPEFNYFRGVTENNRMIDLDRVNYIF